MVFKLNQSLEYKTKDVTIVSCQLLPTISLLQPTTLIIHTYSTSRCMDAHTHTRTQSVTSEQFHESRGPTVCRCLSDFPVPFIHLQSPPECLSVSALLCLNPCKNKGAREASTCNFSAINGPMKHSSESSYYSFPIPPS